MTTSPWNLGSTWHRWDPHLHGPGTLRNNQFGSDWEAYLRRIEEARPKVSALGITDYFSLRCYKEVVRRRREEGVLSSIPLIFANIELRLTIETEARQGINLHLLVCPEDPDHVRRMEEKLSAITFEFRRDKFTCTDEGLIRLGRIHKQDQGLPDEAALQEGANQFKVELSQIKELFRQDAWIHSNVLIAVAGGTDGLSGISKDASFRAQREELGRLADIILSGNPSDRNYWLGQHKDFADNGQTPKPCLHGSDAHKLEAVLAPDLDRRCWIRARPTFEGLKQTLAEPSRRVFIGPEPPPGPSRSNVIANVRFNNAAWITNTEIQINDGLVTIIGAKGSGKTALVDLIAYATGAGEREPAPASFIKKAGRLLDGLKVEIEWGDGERQEATYPEGFQESADPRVRYLSQQFVERLCSDARLAEPLIDEIERVVFSAIPEEDRLECATFSELRDLSIEIPLLEREVGRGEIRDLTGQIAEESKFINSRPSLIAKAAEAERARKTIEATIASLPKQVDDEKAKAYSAIFEKLQQLKAMLASGSRRTQGLQEVLAETQQQIRTAAASLQALKKKHPGLLDETLWQSLSLRTEIGAIDRLKGLIEGERSAGESLREHGIKSKEGEPASGTAGLVALTKEVEKLQAELGLDQSNIQRRGQLETNLIAAKTAESKAKAMLQRAQEAEKHRKEFQSSRLASYERIVTTLVQEEEKLRGLYAPFHKKIAGNKGLSKLSFTVHRLIDLDTWVARGEKLFDLRKPPFSPRGVLKEIAIKELLPSWQRGKPIEVRQAMEAFITNHANKAIDSLANEVTPQEFGEWLFSTDHISVRYGIQYEGVEIANLSPGTRGVVLLTLYLALDQSDQRPLIIDQPEENLDPQSVFSDLVPFFREAAMRRQIVMVTHNANLVVNTDSDQVIASEASRRSPKNLPDVTYRSGGLEDLTIRGKVCNLLEGGEEAFRKRSMRYGVRT